MSQLNVNVVAPLGYTGPDLPGDSNFVEVVDKNGNTAMEITENEVIVVNPLKVNVINPSTGTSVTVSGVEIDAPITSSIAIGNNAMNSSVAGDNSVVIGDNAYQTPTGIAKSVIIGSRAMQNSVLGTAFSVAIGYDAMRGANTSNASNGSVAIGYQSLFNTNALSGGNVAVGKDTLLFSTTGSSNTAIGTEAGKAVTTGNGNVLVGNLSGSALTTGSSNVFLGQGAAGFNSGDIFTGNNCTAIGYFSNPSSLTVNNEITLGNTSVTTLRCNVTSITSLSDARDKKEISELSAGLDFVKTLKPVEFVWNDRDNEAKRDIKDFGFIAQDLKKSQEDAELADTLKLVYESNPEKLEASYGKLIPILVKAIQDLSAKVEALEAQ
jgi:hypothetical protein